MIGFEIKGDIGTDIFRMLGEWAHHDPMPLAQEVCRILKEENAEGLKRGVDAYGEAMRPVEPATIERGRGGFGPPLVPRFDASRMISGFEAAPIREGDSGYLIVAGWPAVDFVKYHQMGFTVHSRKGDRFIEPRAPAGIRPSTNIQIDEAIDRECLRYLEGKG